MKEYVHVKKVILAKWNEMLKFDRGRQNTEAAFLAVSRPSLNEKIDSKKLLLFHNSVTWQFYSFNF